MKKQLRTLCMAFAAIATVNVSAQGLEMKEDVLANPENEPAPVHPLPHERQLKWNETEFYAFFHYGVNTYTGREWGNGDEDESLFAPTAAPNPRQWLEAAKKAGMRGGIAVVKHHDGFCLWPTETTDHNCTNSGNDFAKQTNIPRDFAAAAKELDMKYGFYISPWDRNSYWYGTDKYVKDVFLRQCAELAQYGTDQFEMWFDGANGGTGYYGGRGGNVTVDQSTYYDVPNLCDTVHSVCPDCVLWGVGGEARWIGNEAGWAGETNWAPINRGFSAAKNENGEEEGWLWEAGESDAKATSGGWFWHNGETVSSAERLFQMYLETVGRNATLILNLPPDQSGSLPQATAQRMEELGAMLADRLGNDLAQSATIKASDTRAAGATRKYKAVNMLSSDKDTYWAASDGNNTATITLKWKKEQTVRYVMLQEYIRLGQRVKSFTVETSTDGKTWTKRGGSIATTTIGYKRILPLNGNTAEYHAEGFPAKYVRITINDSKACPTLSRVAVY